jgi:hypothetical protein
MKKLLLLLVVVIVGLSLQAQTSAKFVYSEIVGTAKFMSTKVTIEVSFGQKVKTYADNRLKDPATGKPIVFNSMIDALNYMGDQGWEFVQAFAITESNQNVYHYLLKKPSEEIQKEEQKETTE